MHLKQNRYSKLCLTVFMSYINLYPHLLIWETNCFRIFQCVTQTIIMKTRDKYAINTLTAEIFHFLNGTRMHYELTSKLSNANLNENYKRSNFLSSLHIFLIKYR